MKEVKEVIRQKYGQSAEVSVNSSHTLHDGSRLYFCAVRTDDEIQTVIVSAMVIARGVTYQVYRQEHQTLKPR